MKQILQNMRTGKTEVIDVPIPKTRPGTVLIQTMASLVSAGTERNVVEFAEKNLVEKARSRPDLVKQVVEKAKREGIVTTLESAMNRLDQPLALGYSSAGIVVEVGDGVTNFQSDDRVVCAGGGHAVHAEFALIPVNLLAHLPDDVNYESGAFATVASIALNGIRLANLQVGETVLVIGLGLLGLLAAKLCKSAGCLITGLDINPDKVNAATQLGIDSVARADINSIVTARTRGRGFDCVLICADTPSDDTVELAGAMARDRGKVICIGAVGLNLPRRPYYEKELYFQISRSYGPGRYDVGYEEKGNDYPIGYVRWTEGRNLEAITDLLSSGNLKVDDLISHRFPIKEGEKAYDLITGKTGAPFLGVLISYSETKELHKGLIKTKNWNPHNVPGSGTLKLGVIGAGNYATAVFLPMIKKSENVSLKTIVSANGVSAAHSAGKFGFEHSASDAEAAFGDPQIDVVALLTRHTMHAEQVLRCLQSSKHVFCEKPLGVTIKELQAIETQLNKTGNPLLTVGFNRRFAPMGLAVRDFFSQRTEAMHLYYRVNAGFIPANHWVHDEKSGAGRIIGEGCHFIDFAAYVINRPIKSIDCRLLPDNGKYSGDNAVITLGFSDGSIAIISYLANGDKTASKEYIEGFCAGKTAILNDFRSLDMIENGRNTRLKSTFKQDKGHRAIWDAFIKAINQASPAPIPYDDLLLHSYATIAAVESAKTGEKINLETFIRR